MSRVYTDLYVQLVNPSKQKKRKKKESGISECPRAYKTRGSASRESQQWVSYRGSRSSDRLPFPRGRSIGRCRRGSCSGRLGRRAIAGTRLRPGTRPRRRPRSPQGTRTCVRPADLRREPLVRRLPRNCTRSRRRTANGKKRPSVRKLSRDTLQQAACHEVLRCLSHSRRKIVTFFFLPRMWRLCEGIS